MDMIQSVIRASDSIYAVTKAQDRLEVMSMYGGKVKRITVVLPAFLYVCFYFIFRMYIYFTEDRRGEGHKKEAYQMVRPLLYFFNLYIKIQDINFKIKV